MKEVLDSLKKWRSRQTKSSGIVFGYGLSPALAAVLCFVAFSNLHFGKPIACLMPSETGDTWKDFYHHFCFINGTHRLHRAMRFDTTHNVTASPEDKIDYYQWVPSIFFVEMLLFLLPPVVYKSMAHRFAGGSDMDGLMKLGEKVKDGMDDGKAKIAARAIAQYAIRQKQGFLGGRRAYVLYSLTSWLCVFVAYIQLEVLRATIGRDDQSWAAKTVSTWYHGTTDPESEVFPSISYCSVDRIDYTNVQRTTMQCLLLMNFLNEKLFVILYFWIIAYGLASAWMALFTTLHLWLPTFKRDHLINLLKPYHQFGNEDKGGRLVHDELRGMYAPEIDREEIKSGRLIKKLDMDGYHVLELIEESFGALVAGLVARHMTRLFYTTSDPSDLFRIAPDKVKEADAKKGEDAKKEEGEKEKLNVETTACIPINVHQQISSP